MKLAVKQRGVTLEAKINLQFFRSDIERQETSTHYTRKLSWCDSKRTALYSHPYNLRNI